MSIQLQRYAKPVFTSSITDDTAAPFSFKDWYDAHQGIIPGQEFNQYNDYLVDWYKQKSEQVTDFNLTLKLNYLALLRQLQLFFSKEEAENWYNQVNLDSEKELLLSIPYFARKLKDISLYYLQLRNSIKESRLKYNQTGTNFGIIQQLQKFILTNYTKKPTTSISLPSSIWREVPDLSGVKDFITVQIEELYDSQSYFDQIPTLPVSAYYNVNDTELLNFLNSKGLNSTDTDWIYKIGANFLSANYVNLSSEDILQLSLELSKKYLAQDKFITTNTSFSTEADFFEINLNQGNNYLYWPQGSYRAKADSLQRYLEVDINSSGLNSVATPGSSIELADTIFVQTTRGLSGAWFRNFLYDFKTENMEADIEPSTKTTFRFPFPGYGVSAQDISWTGYGLVSEPRFFFLEEKIQQLIQSDYWSNSINLTSTEPIKINDTTLIYNGAYPSTTYNRADRVTVWSEPPTYDSTSFSGKVTEAWLYRMNQTDISIGLNDNVIVWPYEKIDPLNDFPTYFAKNLTDVCNTLPVSSINFSYAIAGSSPSSADIIYKLANYRQQPGDAIECCWLSGTSLEFPVNNLILQKQNNFQLLLPSGEYTSFAWYGNDDTNIENVFKTIKHQSDCAFLKIPNPEYTDYNKCTCKQVMFVPFGHPGSKYQDYNSFTDFIIEGQYTPGISDLTEFVSTSAFAWYRTNSKIGFGDGRWYSGDTNSDNQFYLKQGKVYTYYRALIPSEPEETSILPDYVVKHKLDLQAPNDRQWIKAVKNSDGKWISTGVPTAMSLTPGDIILYQRTPTSNYSLTGTSLEFIDTAENRGSIWSNYDYITVGEGVDASTRPVLINYPYETTLGFPFATAIRQDPYDPLQLQAFSLLSSISSETPVVFVSSFATENAIFNVLNVTSFSAVNTTSTLSTTIFSRITSVDPSPRTYGIYYEPNNTVTFVFQVTGTEVVRSGTISVSQSAVNVPASLSAATLTRIRNIDPTPNSYGVYFEPDNTVTFVFQVTGIQITPIQLIPPQYPPITINNIVSILQWEVTSPDGSKNYFRNTPSVMFTPALTGVYSTVLTAMSSSQVPPRIVFSSLSAATFFYVNTGIFIFSNIPQITADPVLQTVPTLSSFKTTIPGYVLNTALNGWDYSAGTLNPGARFTNAGAKPYWAKSYIEKDENTGFKGINSWGNPQRLVDKYNIITQPEISELVFNTGDKVEYSRNYPAPLKWSQPVNLRITVNTNNWCRIDFNESAESNLSYILENYKNELVVTPTTATSEIKLQNFIDNQPEEIFYNAINPFVWSITAYPVEPVTVYNTASSNTSLTAIAPWANLPNRFYPTVAALPVTNNLYSDTDTGGYFVPKNLGAGVYVNQDYTVTLNLTSPALSSYFQDVTKQFGGRGLTKEDQPVPYDGLLENNIWLKEPTVAGPIAGTIKKNIFKKYQKFIPYQSGYETNPRLRLGLLTPVSRQTPWTGEEDSEWGDLLNYPLSPTGELNVQVWSDAQILKQNKLQIDNWCTDIFGNQYGLYKTLSSTNCYTSKFEPGEIWIRKNSQLTQPASLGLKDVFDNFQSISLYHELTGKGIQKIDVFFDTLLIQTSGTVIFEKIIYDYTNDNIFSLTDEVRYLSLAMPVSANLDREFAGINLSNQTYARAGDTWFFPSEKIVIQSVCGLKNNTLTPELYRLDINTQIFRKIFPTNNADILTINALSGLNLITIDPPTLSHNTLRKEFLFTVLGKNNENKNVVIEVYIKDLPQLYIDKVVVYTPLQNAQLIDPPFISQTLKTDIEITNLEYENKLDFQCVAENGPVTYEPVSLPSWVTLTPTGQFKGTPPFKTAQYIAEFIVKNAVGPSYYSLIINVNYIEIITVYYFYTEGYIEDGYLVQEEHDVGDTGTGLVSRLVE